ncbi:hypothetical protein P5673_014927 [Acropora cervicornis]|uniref:Uncharacterized protein n=1 Tax=Acropora cervicornis TaxID=6130 RepID=A0AAD9V5M7_ACRCE|nr:hypothetical protein P5673_014927 [Acropora cervicornis]
MIIAIPHANSNPKWKEGNSGPSELERDFGPPSILRSVNESFVGYRTLEIVSQRKLYFSKISSQDKPAMEQ